VEAVGRPRDSFSVDGISPSSSRPAQRARTNAAL
jgi:hypothetical protein